ncbi:MAG: ABC transporter ATP-binding protein [Clostridia bacterium]|nr:ABC transporter ATP-binding protein [Clostridia bacterium]
MFVFERVRYRGILDIPDLQIPEGKITTFVGPSGSGKTTILRLLNKMISPTSGRILYQDQVLESIDSVTHRRSVIMLPQNPLPFPGTVRDNLNLGFRMQHRPDAPDQELTDLLPRLSLGKKLDDPVDRLSGGEMQRLALGRVLLLDAPVYLLDEPSSALDESTEDLIFQILSRFAREKQKTLIMVTHSSQVAQTYSDRIIRVTDEGRVQPEKEGVGHE